MKPRRFFFKKVKRRLEWDYVGEDEKREGFWVIE